MAKELGSFATGTTGNKVVSLNNITNPRFITFYVGAKASDSANHSSTGWYDDVSEINACLSDFTDSTGSASYKSTSECVAHYERVSGTITKKVAGSVTAIGTDDFTVNLTAADANYSIFFVAEE